jgi:hypothetical protein
VTVTVVRPGSESSNTVALRRLGVRLSKPEAGSLAPLAASLLPVLRLLLLKKVFASHGAY